MPDVGATETESVGLQAHRLVGDVAGQHHEVGPAQLVAVLLLDGPEETASLVEVGVVGPRVEGRKTLVAGARTTAAVGHAIRAGHVPSHADHETAVMTPVGRPPVLAVGHEFGEVGFHGGHVE